MSTLRSFLLRGLSIAALLLTSPSVFAQSDVASERSRLGNERARIEADRRAQDELEQQEQQSEPVSAAAVTTTVAVAPEPAKRPRAAPGSAEPTVAVAPVEAAVPPMAVPSAETASTDISKALEQLRELGDLKDAGLVTEEEFERIKKRILDSQF